MSLTFGSLRAVTCANGSLSPIGINEVLLGEPTLFWSERHPSTLNGNVDNFRSTISEAKQENLTNEIRCRILLFVVEQFSSIAADDTARREKMRTYFVDSEMLGDKFNGHAKNLHDFVEALISECESRGESDGVEIQVGQHCSQNLAGGWEPSEDAWNAALNTFSASRPELFDSGVTASSETRADECTCSCGCADEATETDEGGNAVCGACSEYTTDDDGETHCSREYDGETCPHCGGAISWTGILTGQQGTGSPNYRDGECGCGTWHMEERGSWTVPSYEAGMVKCECGEIDGQFACGSSGPRSEVVQVEHMPAHLRDSHVAAGNRGVYPHNGAVRYSVLKSHADDVVDGDWTFVVQ